MTDMTLTLDKDGLLTKLRERREKVVTEDKYTTEIQSELDALGDKDSQAEALAEWHIAVAEGLRNGSIAVSNAGRLQNVPPKPNMERGKKQRFGGWTREMLEHELANQAERLTATVRPLDAAIELLELSTGDTVTINSGDYQKLLSISGGRYY